MSEEWKPVPLGGDFVETSEPEGKTAAAETPVSTLDIEKGLVTAVLDTGNMKEAVTKKIYTNYFMGSDKPVWEFMLDHYRNFKKAPELAAIKRKFPEWEPMATKEPVEYFIRELQERQRFNLILKGMKEISSGLNAKNSQEAFKELTKLVSLINTEVQIHRDVNWNKEVEERKARVKHRMTSLGVDGISYGIDLMDNATGGMHGGELITVLGKPGTGKHIKYIQKLVA